MKAISGRYVVLISIWLLASFALCEDLADCGGFVKASSKLAAKLGQNTIDYSAVKINLLTVDGHIKATTECTPNGYYFFPVYDKGTFVIKTDKPEGWHFEPVQRTIKVTDDFQCNNGENINFELTGFTLSGKVAGDSRCESNGQGPSDVKLTLVNDETKQQVGQVVSKNGDYKFENVFPGRYSISAEHSSWTFVKKSVSATVGFDNTVVTEAITVSGYDISGKVLERTASGEPVADVDFILYSDKAVDVKCPPVTQKPAGRSGNALCSVKSNSQGTFSFANIPCGEYIVVPHYRGQQSQTAFDVVPAQVKAVVNAGSVVISEPFLVKGFSIVGKVVDSTGNGISGAHVKLSGSDKPVVTEKDGSYKLEQITSDTYSITVTKEHYVFEPVRDLKITPNLGSVPAIRAVKYDVCGKVSVNHASFSASNRQIILMTESGSQLKSTTDSAGKFCFQVGPGRYIVSPYVSSTESSNGLWFSGQDRQIAVESVPVLDLVFSQAKLTVSGRVKCLEVPCARTLSVSLISTSRSNEQITTGLAPTIAGEDKSEFVFKDVLPGKYQLEVIQDNWCWEKEVIEVDVSSKDVNNIEFLQKGYQLDLTLSHPAEIEWGLEGSNVPREKKSLEKGSHELCLTKPGVYSVKPISCFKFEKETYKFDTAQPKRLDMNAVAFGLKGAIYASEKNDDITIKAIEGDKQTAVTARYVGEDNKGPKYKYKYEYVHFAKANQQVEFRLTSGGLFFYPQTVSAQVAQTQECFQSLTKVIARAGLFFVGSITPPIPGVDITIVDADNEANIILEGIKTGSDGTYRAGPLPDDRAYKTRAAKEGFNFKESKEKPGSFVSLKLGYVTVTVQDENSQPVVGALISLSGDDYRKNNPTDKDGKLVFKDLFPGKYYLKAVLKEYTFESSNKEVTVNEGTESQVLLKAKRTAFSCYGSVKALNQDTEKQVVVEAKSTDGSSYEETQTDNNGNFRLRGLLPGKQYTISVKKQASVDRSSPASRVVKIERADVTGFDFTLFRKSPAVEIAGVVKTNQPTALSLMKVELYGEDKTTLLKTVQLGPQSYFEFAGLEARDYFLRVRSVSESGAWTLTPAEQYVKAEAFENNSRVSVNLAVDAKANLAAEEVVSGSYYAVTLTLIGIFIAYNYKAVSKLYASYIRGEKDAKVSSNGSSDWLGHLQKKKKNK
jgi:hypothetical protein